MFLRGYTTGLVFLYMAKQIKGQPGVVRVSSMSLELVWLWLISQKRICVKCVSNYTITRIFIRISHGSVSRRQSPPEDSLGSSSFSRRGLYVDWIGQSPPVARWWLYVSQTRRHPDALFHGRIIPTSSIAFFTSRGGVCEYPLCHNVCACWLLFPGRVLPYCFWVLRVMGSVFACFCVCLF